MYCIFIFFLCPSAFFFSYESFKLAVYSIIFIVFLLLISQASKDSISWDLLLSTNGLDKILWILEGFLYVSKQTIKKSIALLTVRII